MRGALLAFLLGASALVVKSEPDGIVRLAPNDFRQLPAVVRRDLARRGCMIPQVPRKTAPHNVLAGAFISSGSRDWAVLCSVGGQSRVLVYRSGGISRVDSVGRWSDSSFLQDGGTGVREYARRIELTTREDIQDHAKAAGETPPASVDHDGISDAVAGGTALVRYYRRGRWVELELGK